MADHPEPTPHPRPRDRDAESRVAAIFGGARVIDEGWYQLGLWNLLIRSEKNAITATLRADPGLHCVRLNIFDQGNDPDHVP